MPVSVSAPALVSAPAPSDTLEAPHGAQTVSAVALHALSTHDPGAHVVHRLHPSSLAYWFVGHDEHWLASGPVQSLQLVWHAAQTVSLVAVHADAA